MAIVKMSRFDLAVRNHHTDPLLSAFQRFGEISFIDLAKQETGRFKAYPDTYDFDKNRSRQEQIQSILNDLNAYYRRNSRRKMQDLGVIDMSYEELEARAKVIDIEELLELYSEFYQGDGTIVEGYEAHAPWYQRRLDTSEMEKLSHPRMIIGTLEKDKVQAFEKELVRCQLIYFMHRDEEEKHRRIYSIYAHPDNVSSVEILVDKYDLEQRSAVSLHIEKDVLKMQKVLGDYIDRRKNIRKRLENVGSYREALQIYYEYLKHEELKEQSRLLFLKSETMTAISGWIITEEEAAFRSLVETVTDGEGYLEIAPAPLHSTEVPILLRNKGFNQPFELITNMYSQPRYDELDPTPLFAPFYALFFGMMLADVGYGLLMGIASFAALKLINLKKSTQTFMSFLFYLSFPTMIWGFIYGAFFGGMIPLKGLIDINSSSTFVLVLAMGIGILHLFFALAVKGYLYLRDYKKRYVFYDVILWYILLTATIMLVSGMFTDFFVPYNDIAWGMFIFGAVGVVLTNGRSARTLGGKAASGLYSLYGLSNYVSDVVSYSRLMALGLAGGSIGMAFNMMIQMVQGMGILSIIFGALIFMIGHGFNIFISGLSAYVHSARLIYVEFFGKFYVGGGKPFQSFRAKPTYINVK